MGDQAQSAHASTGRLPSRPRIEALNSRIARRCVVLQIGRGLGLIGPVAHTRAHRLAVASAPCACASHNAANCASAISTRNGGGASWSIRSRGRSSHRIARWAASA